MIGTLMAHLQPAREVARVLSFDAMLRAHDGDREGALTSIRAILNAARSVGDEPTAVSQLVRVSCRYQAIKALERALAQGQVPEASLGALQHLLEEDDKQPLHLIAARAERAAVHQFLELMRTGRFNRAAYALKPSLIGSQGDDFVDRAKATAVHAAYLRFHTELVEVAKMPPEQQDDRLQQLKPPEGHAPILLNALGESPGGHRRTPESFRRSQAALRCAIVALAAERYRLRHDRWPESLQALVPELLGQVPADPFDGNLLRYRQREDGVVVYSIGPDSTDSGGNLARTGNRLPGTDLGFRLWNADRRSQPPNPPK